ncbi:MAG: WD40 repeat domain-containing protein [Lewinellaceae bacterium]|nr:WD40 repeat domain-containing protein [Lewinellaceae bacterium]
MLITMKTLRLRYFLLLCVLLASGPKLRAQVEQQKLYYQQNIMAQSVLPPINTCYTSAFDLGKKAYAAGNCREASLQLKKALACPEARDNVEFQQQANWYLSRCEDKTATTPLPILGDSNQDAIKGRGRYQSSQAFKKFDDPNCFEMTRKEADRAYALRYWEDAAALYRAAKICADADQNERQSMNERIELCRIAAENELLQKEQEAIRMARHALASNRANDAEMLLQKGDRTTAFRLADFANNFIAPGDIDLNADCLQAMYDAWYYNLGPGTKAGNRAIAPFCYQLEEDLGAHVQVRFVADHRSIKLFAFAPEKHTVYSWDAKTLQPGRSFQVDSSYQQFDVAPDAGSFVFRSPETIVLWRDTYRSYSITATPETVYEFEANGRYFRYYDPLEGQILSVDLNAIFGMKKGYQQQRVGATNAQVKGISNGLKSFVFPDNKTLWLYYPDSLIMLQKNQQGDGWERNAVWNLPVGPSAMAAEGTPGCVLSPDSQSAVISMDTSTAILRFSPTSNMAEIAAEFPGTFLATNVQANLSATLHYNTFENDFQLQIFNNTDHSLLFYSNIPALESYFEQTGAIAPDGQYFCMATENGTLRLWLLDEKNNTNSYDLKDAFDFSLSPDANKLAIWNSDKLRILDCNQTGLPLIAALPRPEDNAPEMHCDNNWLTYRYSFDSVGIWNWNSQEHWLLKAPPLEAGELPVIIDEWGQRTAVLAGDDTIRIYDLGSQVLLQKIPYLGSIRKLLFLPGQDKLLGIQFFETGQFTQGQFIPKIWDLGAHEKAPEVVRIQINDISQTAVNPTGNKIAFSDGNTIQIYQTNNLLDETAHIRSWSNLSITALRFHPNGNTLIVGYIDGSIVFWDAVSGKMQLKLPPQGNFNNTMVDEISLDPDGRTLRAGSQGEKIVTFLLDPAAIRASAQDEYRQLLVFSPEQIRDYELDEALEFQGNFERLALSGDIPLMRSFYNYYRSQAINGNNIEHVSLYCDRAFRLYDQFDRKAQENLRPSMLEMYESFNWKLLLRNRLADAARVVAHVNRYFNNPVEGSIMAAHTALLQGKTELAAKQYTDWAISNAFDQQNADYSFDQLLREFRQLAEYQLLDNSKLACICGLFDTLLHLGNLCQTLPVVADNTVDQETDLRWSVFLSYAMSDSILNHSQKVAVLAKALEKTHRLQSHYRGDYTEWEQKLTLALAETFASWSFWEASVPEGLEYRIKAIELLSSPEGFKQHPQQRNLLLARQYKAAGDWWLITQTPEKRFPFIIMASAYLVKCRKQ